MNYKQDLLGKARIVASRFDNLSDIPFVNINGSIGDPFGYITSLSDLDLGVWTANPEYLGRKPAINWNPYRYRGRKHQQVDETGIPTDGIEIVSDVEGGHEATVYFMVIDPDRVRKEIKELPEKDVSRSELNRFIRAYVEALPYKDTLNFYESGKQAAIEAFARHRERMATETLGGLNLIMLKLRDDAHLSRRKEPIDLRAYNGRVIAVLNGMTYILCCTRNVPRSSQSIEIRRNNVLWEALGLDMSRIDATMSVTQNVKPSYDALTRLTREIYEEAKRELPGIADNEKSVKKILD